MFDVSVNGKVKAEIMTIGPDTAQSLLERNTNNRDLSPQHVKDYVRRMEQGDWHLSTDAIGIDTQGRLVNGQHRLHAIIKSGQTQPFIVVKGIDPDAFKWIDEIYKRNLKQSLKMAGFSRYSRLAALVSMLYSWEQGKSPLSGQPSNVQGINFAKYHSPKIVGAIEEVKPIETEAKRLWRPSSMNFVNYTMYRRSPETARDFLEGVATGLGLNSKNDPRYRLRNRLISEQNSPGGRVDRKLELALTIKACNKYFRQESVKSLRWSPRAGEEFPEPEHGDTYPFGYFE
jgi:hypothetical protein